MLRMKKEMGRKKKKKKKKGKERKGKETNSWIQNSASAVEILKRINDFISDHICVNNILLRIEISLRGRSGDLFFL